ncbi:MULTISPECIES: hypothetical protein [unclassified Streptomyces]|uniref:hypothetical protein n=1 Tax=unclassified Streptomyces TaxID=2593676 RepID=UPI00380EB512
MDGLLLVDAEDEREVERIGAAGEGVFGLSVDAEPFEGDGLAARRRRDGDTADGRTR